MSKDCRLGGGDLVSFFWCSGFTDDLTPPSLCRRALLDRKGLRVAAARADRLVMDWEGGDVFLPPPFRDQLAGRKPTTELDVLTSTSLLRLAGLAGWRFFKA